MEPPKKVSLARPLLLLHYYYEYYSYTSYVYEYYCFDHYYYY